MNAQEKKITLSLSLLMTFRMLGLFMILPIFSIYAHTLNDVTPKLIGLALGIYGLTQACFQMPLAILSDHIGRKPVIVGGLVLFVIGSIVAALSHSIEGIIIGRALQGSGAIGSTIIAIMADSTELENRTKAMAIIGMNIGIAFAAAMVLGPILYTYIGMSGIFWLTAFMALIGIGITLFRLPPPSIHVDTNDTHKNKNLYAQFKEALTDSELIRLNIGIFIQHAILTAIFVVMPIILIQQMHISESHQWLIYLPILVIAYILMVPFIIIAEKKHKMKPIFIGSIFCILLSQLLLSFSHENMILLIFALLIFFTAFTLLEATLPSLISKFANPKSKGTAMGIYSTAQFLGIFVGGVMGGWIFQHTHHKTNVVFLTCALLAFLWCIIATQMQKPPQKTQKQ